MLRRTAFINISRRTPERRPVHERVRDWNEVYHRLPEGELQMQAARCMDCGIPFCHQGCPLGNLIPDWNDLVYSNRWQSAVERLHETNNFPEFTGKLCPAPCEASCVLGINSDPVTIKEVELSIITKAFEEGWIAPHPPAVRTGRRVAVVGSGPAGLAAAQQLNRAGHWVTVFERDDRIGGLLRYGIPEFKMEKWVLERRLRLLEAEGIELVTSAHVGVSLSPDVLVSDFDAVVLATGATKPRDLDVPGRDLRGVYFAMEYLTPQNRLCEGDYLPAGDRISAQWKRVVIIGGGDTGSDCLGTAHRQGASSVVQLQLWTAPPPERTECDPWPLYPNIFRTSSSQEEGGDREFGVSTTGFRGKDGRVAALQAVRVLPTPDEAGRLRPAAVPGTEFEIPADMVIVAIGYAGPETNTVVQQLGLEVGPRGNIATDERMMTSRPGVFATGDAWRGQSLIVWAIRDGRHAARHVDAYLMGRTELP